MNSAVLDLFVEDRGHEELLQALVLRLSREEQLQVGVRVRSARGGHGRVLAEFELYQDTILRGMASMPDVLVAAVDANCKPYQEAVRELGQHVRLPFAQRTVLACPDPHVERWLMADPKSFAQVVGVEPARERRKCDRDRYKQLLIDAVRKAGHIPALEGIEFARDLAAAMDLYRAGKHEPSLRYFVENARAALHRVRQQ